MKKNKNLLLSFFLSIVIFGIGMLFNKIYPFGKNILLMLDGYNQYPGFLNSFIQSIKFKQSIFYSFKALIGFNQYAAFVYYSFNFTNLLFLLFKAKHIVDFYTFIIILKIGLCSFTMNIFLNYIKKSKYNFLFSICFALSSYNILYYLNFMWFDSIILLPLVILGVEKIFKENKYYYYVISLALSIISNFYIGYMICIFSLIYFIYKWIMYKCKKEYLFKFIIYSLLTGLVCSFTLIPVILELLNGKGTLFANYTTEYFKFDLDFINVFYKLSIASLLNGDLEYGTPNVYVSIFIYLNVVLYFINKKINKKEKIICGSILCFFLLSMSFNLLDYFWQMMQMPIWYPVRYAFIFDFFLIYLAYKNFINYDKLSNKKIIFTLLVIISLMIIGFVTSGNLIDKINIPAKLIYLGISIMFLIYYIFIENSKDFKNMIWLIIIIELSVNTFVTLKNNGNVNTIDDFNNNYSYNSNIINKLKLDYFDKVSFENRTIKNNGLLFNYNDINYFSSLRNKNTIEYLNKALGILTLDDCNTTYYFNNPIVNSLLGIKYYITKDSIDYYELTNKYNDYNIYLNKDITSLGFITNNSILDLKVDDDYITNLNNIVKIVNNNDKDIISEISIKNKNINCSEFTCTINGTPGYINYEYTLNKDAFIYIQNDYPNSKDKTNYTIKVNGEIVSTSSYYPILVKKKDKLEININPTEDFKDYYYHVYEVDYSLYKEFINNINNEKLKITNYKSDANFTASITLDVDGVLYTNISNDNGFDVYVDNKKEEIIPILNGVIGIKLKEGTHKIKFVYEVRGLKTGLIISSISLLTLIGLLIYEKKHTR